MEPYARSPASAPPYQASGTKYLPGLPEVPSCGTSRLGRARATSGCLNFGTRRARGDKSATHQKSNRKRNLTIPHRWALISFNCFPSILIVLPEAQHTQALNTKLRWPPLKLSMMRMVRTLRVAFPHDGMKEPLTSHAQPTWRIKMMSTRNSV